MAARRNQRLIRGGRVELRHGSMDRLPWRDERFDKLYTVNTVYFWPDPEACLREAMRVLKPGGSLAVGFRGKEVIKGEVAPPARVYSVAEVKAMVEAGGLREVRAAERRRGKKIQHCVRGRK